MIAQYWTITGYDMWRLDEKTVFDLKNLNTGEVVTYNSITDVKEQKFLPVTMPKPKTRRSKAKVTKKRTKTKTKKGAEKAPRGKSKYKGVSPLKTPGKFRAMIWDAKTKKVKHLGTFESELLAAAAVQEFLGNKKESRRLRNEYEEGNCWPEAPEPDVVHKRIFPEEEPLVSDLGRFPSEQ